MRWRAVVIVLSAYPALLKSELLPIRTYTIADGLAADHVDCIVPDSRGFLWFCTPEGLSRFDGYRFVSYGVREGLPHRAVTTLIETRSGDYLVGTARGISRIASAGEGARFTTYVPDREETSYVAALYQARNGKTWCATPRSLFEWSTANGFHRREFPLAPRSQIASIVEDPSGNLWVGTGAGIYLLRENGTVQLFSQRDGLPGYWVEMLLMDSKGRLWAGIRGGLALLTRQAAGDWRVQRVYTDKSGLASWDAKALLEASDGALWVGTTQGISRLSLGPGEPAVLQNLTRAQGLSDRQVTALAEDQAGNIWAGTEGAGVVRIDRLGFTAYREQDGLPTDRVFSVFEDRAGELMTVTTRMRSGPSRSLDIFDGKRFRDVTPKRFDDRASWGWNQILIQSRNDEWWAATKDGLCRYSAVAAAELGGRNPRICYAPEDDVFRVFEDSRGGIWASAQSQHGDQLMRWDPRTNAVLQFPAPRIPGGTADDLVSAFAEDRQGNIWMGLYKGGLYRYDGRVFHYFKRSDSVPAGSIVALLAGEDGLWIASTGGGLGYIANTAEDRPRFEIYNAARGMASDTVNCIVKDHKGRIYAGTAKGVDRLDPKTGYIRHFSSGLPHGEFTSAVRDHSGSLWFATKQGLARLVPAEDRPSVHPRVFITDLRIGGAVYPLSLLGETRVSRLELKPSQNQLQVEFVGLDYEPGDVLRYSYKLEGADPDWNPPRSQLIVNYAALAGGKYRFLVKAVTSEGVESAVPAGIDFTVLPPVWKRWWFESLAVAFAAALVLGAHRYRVMQAVNLERVRTAIATDLHDDLGASLSHIAVLSEVARTGVHGEDRRTQESLQRIAVLARELVDSLGDIVWSIRSVPDGFHSLVSRMREFALDLLAGQRIDFELRSPPAGHGDQYLSLQERRHLFLMFKECVHNIGRHSGCTAVKAELKVVDREIVLTVADNGRGLNPAEEVRGSIGGNGIPGMRRRAESLGGSIQFLSKPGEGCTVCIRLPLRRRPFGVYRA